MLKYYIKTTEALKSLREDRAGVVSFEYIIVAACVVAVVAAVYGTNAGGTLGTALSDSLKAVATFITGKITGLT
jgi:Flp pilus assembly pilin Flp